ncbi:hypothetical protein T484DRAFT_1615246 [Baffinella frigidus]|nr:hypothetical protein T484DRAFT_1615246 [Cryptophyta sp. CCMP2293]
MPWRPLALHPVPYTKDFTSWDGYAWLSQSLVEFRPRDSSRLVGFSPRDSSGFCQGIRLSGWVRPQEIFKRTPEDICTGCKHIITRLFTVISPRPALRPVHQGLHLLGRVPSRTLDHQPSTLNPRPSTLDPQPSTLSPQPSTLNPQPSTLNPQPSTLNPRPSTLNPQPSTLDP